MLLYSLTCFQDSYLKVKHVLSRDVPEESMWTQLTIERMTSVADHMHLRHRNKVYTLSHFKPNFDIMLLLIH